jgi:hypothetical protein
MLGASWLFAPTFDNLPGLVFPVVILFLALAILDNIEVTPIISIYRLFQVLAFILVGVNPHILNASLNSLQPHGCPKFQFRYLPLPTDIIRPL